MKPNIVVIGSTNTDMIIKVPHIPSPGETILGGEFSIIQGGKGANQAVAAARAGGQVTFISCVGNDSFGKQSLKELAKDNIDTSAIKVAEGQPSGVAMINVSENGENSISVAPGSNNLLLPEDIEKNIDIIKNADIILLQLEIPLETVRKAIRMTSSFNIPTILNPAPAQELDEEIMTNTNIITPNEQEAVQIAGFSKNSQQNSTDLLNALRAKGVKTIVMTLGEKGVVYTKNSSHAFLEGHKVNAIDTTGAGDTFNGYLAVSLAKGMSLEFAVAIANKAAALSVTRLGAQPSIPCAEEVNLSKAEII